MIANLKDTYTLSEVLLILLQKELKETMEEIKALSDKIDRLNIKLGVKDVK